MERYLMISDAAKEVQVESHVLRYWEEELHLPIRRNELGHRYYTEEDVELFKQIKSMKEGGLQLKAIKMILKDGKLDVMLPEEDKAMGEEILEEERRNREAMAIEVIGSRKSDVDNVVIKQADAGMQDEKARRLQWLLQQLFRETLQENNKELCREIKESVLKELDYQFRVQEEREEERDRIREQRDEAHYQKLDAMLRKKVKRGKQAALLQEADVQVTELQVKEEKMPETRIEENVAQKGLKPASNTPKKNRGEKKRVRFFKNEAQRS